MQLLARCSNNTANGITCIQAHSGQPKLGPSMEQFLPIQLDKTRQHPPPALQHPASLCALGFDRRPHPRTKCAAAAREFWLNVCTKQARSTSRGDRQPDFAILASRRLFLCCKARTRRRHSTRYAQGSPCRMKEINRNPTNSYKVCYMNCQPFL